MPIEQDLERRSGAGGAADVWTFRRISVMKLGGGGWGFGGAQPVTHHSFLQLFVKV